MSNDDAGLDYAEFGQLFFETAVTEARIRGAFERFQQRPINFGPQAGGPRGMAQISGQGSLDDVDIKRTGRSPLVFALVLPVRMDIAVRLTGITYNFAAVLSIPLTLTARARRPLVINLDVTPPATKDIGVDLKPRGRSGAMLARMADMTNEIQRYAAKYASQEIEGPAVRALCEIDIAHRLEKSWSDS